MRAGWVKWVAMVALMGACAGDDNADTAATDSVPAVSTPATPAAPALGDAEIAHVAVTANTIDKEAGEHALSKSTNADIKQFAQTMIADHTGVNQQAGALAQKLGVTPMDNAVSQQLKTEADAAKADLATKTGVGFDRGYIAREVAYHQGVLNALDQVLIPGAQNAELKTLLEKVRPAIAAHLQMAQQLQAKLGS